MKELGVVLQGFREATRCEAGVWIQSHPGDPLVAEALAAPGLRAPPAALRPEPGGVPHEIHTADGTLLVASVPGARRAWLRSRGRQ